MTTQTAPTPPATIHAGLRLWLGTRGLTPRELDLVAAYVRLRDAGDGVIGPSQRDLSRELDVTASSVNGHVVHLCEKGVFALTPHKRAGLRLLWDEAPRDGGDVHLRAAARSACHRMRYVARLVRKTFPSFADDLNNYATTLDAAVDGDGRKAK